MGMQRQMALYWNKLFLNLHLAILIFHPLIIFSSGFDKIIDILVKKGCHYQVHSKDNQGNIPLQRASALGKISF